MAYNFINGTEYDGIVIHCKPNIKVRNIRADRLGKIPIIQGGRICISLNSGFVHNFIDLISSNARSDS